MNDVQEGVKNHSSLTIS